MMINKISELTEHEKMSIEADIVACQPSQLIEKEYINSMLDIGSEEAEMPENTPDTLDYNSPYRNDDIECTVFKVAGLNLALPGSIIRVILDERDIPIHLTSHLNASMLIGKVKYKNKIIDVIDLNCLVMKGVDDVVHNKYAEKVSNIILLKGCSIGVVYDQLIGIKNIQKSNVCWRGESSSRLWLAGTVVQLGFSLLDIEEVINMKNDECSKWQGV